MTKAQAAERVRKLRALADPTRGGTPGERATATRMIAKLVARYGLTDRDVRQPRSRSPRTTWRAPRRGPASWGFDVSTGRGSPNVKVHHWQNRGNWKIEIPAEDLL